MKPSIAELAWQAGIIDGEGCLTISRQIRKDRASPAFRCVVNVCNTDRRLITPFQRFWHGSIHLRPETRLDKHWKNSWTWVCPQLQVVPFLTAISPYLRAKKAQADLLIYFFKHKHAFPRKSLGQGNGSAPLGEEELAFRESVWNQVRSLNSKGQYARKVVMPNGA